MSENNGWFPIAIAPKNGAAILAIFRSDLAKVKDRPDLARWEGQQVVIRHPGLADDGFDIGWGLAAPVGYGGFPDDWFAGWQPLGSPPVDVEDITGAPA